MTILGPNGVPATPSIDSLTPEQIVEIRQNHWREILPGEQLCGAATLTNGLVHQYQSMVKTATPDQILAVFGQILTDILQLHIEHHAGDAGDVSNAVVEATATDDGGDR